MCSGMLITTIGIVLMATIMLSAASIVIFGALVLSTGFSTIIARDTGELCNIYTDRIQFYANILLEYPEADRLVSMALNARPVSWKHPVIKTALTTFFIIMTIAGMISWNDSIIDDIILVVTSILAIIVAVSIFRVEFASAVQNDSKARLLERAMKYLEKC